MTKQRAERVLVTGACGEIGQALIQGLANTRTPAEGDGEACYEIVTSDLTPLPEGIREMSAEHVQGDLVYKVKTFYDYDFDVNPTYSTIEPAMLDYFTTP